MDDVIPPKNVLRFEACIYLSLLIDALSSAFGETVEGVTSADKLAAAGFIGAFTWLVWLAARRRKNWARMVLVVALGLSALLLIGLMKRVGLTQPILTELVSQALTALGIYFSATGDARGWFDPDADNPRR